MYQFWLAFSITIFVASYVYKFMINSLLITNSVIIVTLLLIIAFMLWVVVDDMIEKYLDIRKLFRFGLIFSLFSTIMYITPNGSIEGANGPVHFFFLFFYIGIGLISILFMILYSKNHMSNE